MPSILQCLNCMLPVYSECLPEVPTKSCDFMREGAPYPPDPPSKLWRPERNVRRYSVYKHYHALQHSGHLSRVRQYKYRPWKLLHKSDLVAHTILHWVLCPGLRPTQGQSWLGVENAMYVHVILH